MSQTTTISRDLRLAHKLWKLVRTDFAWNAYCTMLLDEATVRYYADLTKGKYNKRVNNRTNSRQAYDDYKRRKLISINALEIHFTLDEEQTP